MECMGGRRGRMEKKKAEIKENKIIKNKKNVSTRMRVWNGKKKKKEKWKKRDGEMGSCHCRVLLGERRGRMEKKGNKGGRPTQEWGREKLKKRKKIRRERKGERGEVTWEVWEEIEKVGGVGGECKKREKREKKEKKYIKI